MKKGVKNTTAAQKWAQERFTTIGQLAGMNSLARRMKKDTNLTYLVPELTMIEARSQVALDILKRLNSYEKHQQKLNDVNDGT